MPPKPKFTKEEVTDAALRIIEREGAERLTARSLGEELGSSARPVFTLFDGGMDEVLRSAERAARDCYNDYVAAGMAETPVFKGVGKAYIRFAAEKPKLFRLLFMRERDARIDTVLPQFDENYADILRSVETEYGLDGKQAETLYCHLWIYSHGIAVLCATGSCTFSPEEISDMLTDVCRALIVRIRQKGVL